MASYLPNTRVTWFGIVLPTALLWTIYVTWSFSYQFNTGQAWWFYILLGCKLVVELVAIFYMVCFCFASVAYLQQKRDKPVFKPIGSDYPPVAILYMCCNDLDPDALLSLAMLEYPGELKVIVHDDSQNPQENARVDCICEEIKRRSGRPVLVLRRPTHEGGKPGAVQYVLEQTHHLYDFFLLADSDSYVKSPDVLTQAVSRFDRSEIAIVQCRNRTRQIEKDGPFAKALAWSIDIFDVFMRGVFSYFWSPFVGHNAVLRASAVMKVGGMRPGFFADDIDLSVRLQNQGYVIRYCPDLEISETHPRNYRAFCMRTYKWAMGCVQVLREHTRCVLRSKGFSLLQKIGFFLFCGFYVFQAAVFIYFITICLVMPFVFPHLPLEFIAPLFIGALFPMTVFAPASVYLWKHHRERFWSILIACAGAYGSTDFHVIRGLLRGLVGQSRWIPTNCIDSQGLTIFTWVPYILGLLMLVVPLWQAPWILLVPTTVLFISKFLFIPAIARYYRETPIKTAFCTHGKSIALASSGLLGILIVVLVFAFGFNNPISSTTTKGLMTIEIRGDRFIVNGEEFEIRGIHYSPWRPGSGPHHGNLPTDEEIEQDLELIVRANANTILTFDPSARLLELADRYGLKVIYALHIDWWQIEQGKLSELVQRVEATVRKHKDAPALFAWMLGNEVPEGLINQIGENAIRDAIKTLSNHVRSIDPRHPITHGNWPMTRNLDLEASLDFVSFNLYPYYPPEVAAAGFGQYIEQELKPIAKGRPLLISEFGINTLETTPERQAEILYRCWKELRQVGAAGGIVFEFADEWWKNYDNPVRPPNWWFRKPDPNDHLKHDEDPEEHYGIVTSSRELKPAYEAVRKMFAETAPSAKDGWPGVLSLIAFALVIFVVSMSIYVYRQRSRQD